MCVCVCVKANICTDVNGNVKTNMTLHHYPGSSIFKNKVADVSFSWIFGHRKMDASVKFSLYFCAFSGQAISFYETIRSNFVFHTLTFTEFRGLRCGFQHIPRDSLMHGNHVDIKCLFIRRSRIRSSFWSCAVNSCMNSRICYVEQTKEICKTIFSAISHLIHCR